MRVVRALEICDECEAIAPTVQVGNTRRYVFLCINCLGQAIELFAMSESEKPAFGMYAITDSKLKKLY